MMRQRLPVVLLSLLAASAHAEGPVVLFSNGPIVNLPNGGPGGAHASRVQGELGLAELGHRTVLSTPSTPASIELSDDFTITTPGGWHVTSITLYTLPGTSVGGTTCFPPAVTSVQLGIGDALGNTNVYSGYAAASPAATGMYRVPSANSGETSCPISATTFALSLDLAPGVYWVNWVLNPFALGFTPSAVPVTRNGVTATGNAQARVTSCPFTEPLCPPGPWFALTDGGFGQGLAFEVRGTPESVVKGNLDGQQAADLVFRNTNPASPDYNRNKVWFMNGTARSGEAFVTPDPTDASWAIVGSDDFDSWSAPGQGPDGSTDLVFHNSSTGQVAFWLMNGTTRMGAPVLLTGAAPPLLAWKLSATGDFDGDGRPDLLWRNTTTRKLAIWSVTGTHVTGGFVPTPDEAVNANWAVVAALDYNDDGHRDLLWYNATTGNIVTWYMDAAVQRISGQFVNPPNAGNANWKVVAGGDYSWNHIPGTPPVGSPDIVWRNDTSGNQVVWHLDFTSTRVFGEFTNPIANTSPLDWTIAGPR